MQNKSKHYTMFCFAGVNVKTGEIFPATFPDKGPELALRSARHLTGGQQVSIRKIKLGYEMWAMIREVVSICAVRYNSQKIVFSYDNNQNKKLS